MLSVVRRFAVASVLVSVLTVVGGRPAWACSCAAGPPKLGGPEAIFTGTITGKTTAWWRLWSAGTDYKIHVDQVVQGHVHRTAWVTRKSGGGASCGGFYATVGERVAVVVTGGPYRFHANLCSRTDVAALLTVAPAHRPPAPDGVGIVGHWAWQAVPPILVLVLLGLFLFATGRARRRALHL